MCAPISICETCNIPYIMKKMYSQIFKNEIQISYFM